MAEHVCKNCNQEFYRHSVPDNICPHISTERFETVSKWEPAEPSAAGEPPIHAQHCAVWHDESCNCVVERGNQTQDIVIGTPTIQVSNEASKAPEAAEPNWAKWERYGLIGSGKGLNCLRVQTGVEERTNKPIYRDVTEFEMVEAIADLRRQLEQAQKSANFHKGLQESCRDMDNKIVQKLRAKLRATEQKLAAAHDLLKLAHNLDSGHTGACSNTAPCHNCKIHKQITDTLSHWPLAASLPSEEAIARKVVKELWQRKVGSSQEACEMVLAMLKGKTMDKSERDKILDALGLIPTADLKAILLRIETMREDQLRWQRVDRFVRNGAEPGKPRCPKCQGKTFATDGVSD